MGDGIISKLTDWRHFDILSFSDRNFLYFAIDLVQNRRKFFHRALLKLSVINTSLALEMLIERQQPSTQIEKIANTDDAIASVTIVQSSIRDSIKRECQKCFSRKKALWWNLELNNGRNQNFKSWVSKRNKESQSEIIERFMLNRNKRRPIKLKKKFTKNQLNEKNSCRGSRLRSRPASWLISWFRRKPGRSSFARFCVEFRALERQIQRISIVSRPEATGYFPESRDTIDFYQESPFVFTPLNICFVSPSPRLERGPSLMVSSPDGQVLTPR